MLSPTAKVVMRNGKKTKVKARDAGCQCKTYCGYSCKAACKRDSECYWKASEKKCYNKNYDSVGAPIPVCPPM